MQDGVAPGLNRIGLSGAAVRTLPGMPLPGAPAVDRADPVQGGIAPGPSGAPLNGSALTGGAIAVPAPSGPFGAAAAGTAVGGEAPVLEEGGPGLPGTTVHAPTGTGSAGQDQPDALAGRGLRGSGLHESGLGDSGLGGSGLGGSGLEGAAQGGGGSDVAGPAALPAGVQGASQHPVPGAGSPSADVPAGATVPAVGEVSSAAPTVRSTAADQAALNRQLGGPVARLAEAGPGERSVIVRVSPDTYGPVTIRATIGADGSIKVELTSATDAGREALRSGLADLRRDLAQVLGPQAQLSVDPRTDQGRAGSFGPGFLGQGSFGQGNGHGASFGGEAGSGQGQNGTGQSSAGQNGTGHPGTGRNGPGGVQPGNAGVRGAGHAAEGTAGVVLPGTAAGTAGLDVLA
ncbi:flagellar hook-length control protein FliK [Arthrobacter ginkgonis]|uniref:flagellar hook-length control protein FliK n=1 Tax=Arthrobacter ginkgonis TaxID=1630594 RepID=UPI0031EF0E5E